MPVELPIRFEAPHGRGRGKGKVQNNPRNYEADLWGTSTEQPKAPSDPKVRRGKNGTSIINGITYAPQRLFNGSEMQIPFPDTLISKESPHDAKDEGADTLFSLPVKPSGAAQVELFAPSPETAVPPTKPRARGDQEPKTQTPLPVDPEVGDMPEDLKPFLTYVPFHLLSPEQRQQGVMAFVPTRFFIYFSERFGYMPGIMLESEEDHHREPMNYGVTTNPGDITAAYEKIRHAIEAQGLRQETAAPQESQEVTTVKVDPPPEESQAVPETEINPLLAILREEEIYIDPNEVTIEEAEEKGYPFLRRDVVTYRWWLEFPFDTREQLNLNHALIDAKWRWGSFRQQWHNNAHFPVLPKDMPYANAGPAFYSEENAERIEARATKARERSSAHYERSNTLASIIPFGQPMLRDHYSYRSDLAYRKKIWRQMDLFVEFYKKAEWLEGRAEGSRRLQKRRGNIHAMQDRLDRLQVDLRAMRRGYEEAKAKRATGEYDYYRRRMTILATEILPLQEGIAERGGLPIEKVEKERPLQPGDYILMRGRGVYVLKVNKTTIKVADHSVTYANGQPWESTYKKSDFQRVLATKEELEERKQQNQLS